MAKLNNLIELMANFPNEIYVLDDNFKDHEINDYIQQKKNFCVVAMQYEIKSDNQTLKGDYQTINEPLKDLESILDWIAYILEENGFTYQHCEKCGHYFTDFEGMYKIDDCEYLCEDCHEKEFPTNRDWYIHCLDGYYDCDNDIEYSTEDLEKLSDDELESMLDMAMDEDIDFPCYYTTA